MIKILALFVLFVTVKSSIYGLSETTQLIQIDPTTASVRNISQYYSGEIAGQSLSTVDRKKGILYWIGCNQTAYRVQLLGVDLKNGSILSSVYLPFAVEQFGSYCEFNENTGEVLVSGPYEKDALVNYVYSVNPFSGSLTLITKITAGPVLGNKSGFDPKNNILLLSYANPNITLFAISIPDGKIFYSFQDPFSIETMNYVPSLSLFYGIGISSNSKGSYRTLVTLDAVSGTERVLFQYNQFNEIQAGVSAFDFNTNILYSFMSPKNNSHVFQFVGINILSGSVVSSPNSCVPCSINFA